MHTLLQPHTHTAPDRHRLQQERQGIACSQHVAISNGFHLVDAKLVYQAVKGVVQVGQHEEDLHRRHGGGHCTEAHDVAEEDDDVLV